VLDSRAELTVLNLLAGRLRLVELSLSVKLSLSAKLSLFMKLDLFALQHGVGIAKAMLKVHALVLHTAANVHIEQQTQQHRHGAMHRVLTRLSKC
jgi:hypothetical protein